MIAALGLCARYGRWLLVAGLVAGVALPGPAAVLQGWLPALVSAMIFAAALRIGPERALSALGDVPPLLVQVGLMQLVLPVVVAGLFWAFGMIALAPALALVFVCAAAPIGGAPNLAILAGADPLPALRLLVLGTALLPLTTLPVFAIAGLGGDIFLASARLTAVILCATAAGFALRHWGLRHPSAEQISAIDGASALLMAVLVVGLMAAAGPTLTATPWVFFGWLAFAFVVNFGLQLAVFFTTGDASRAICAGNRNIALFLVALPEQIFAPLLIFVACYQIPMYLTPLVLGRLYRRSL